MEIPKVPEIRSCGCLINLDKGSFLLFGIIIFYIDHII